MLDKIEQRHENLPNYSLTKDISYLLTDISRDFKLLFSPVNRMRRADEWTEHLDAYGDLSEDNIEISKIEFIADHLRVLDAKFNGYLTFLALLGAIAAIVKLDSSAKICETLHCRYWSMFLAATCLPPLCFSILHWISRYHDPNFFPPRRSREATPGDYYKWNFLALVIMAISVAISFCSLTLLFIVWLIYSILLCFMGSQMLYWGGMKNKTDANTHLKGMIRAVIYRTMLYRFAWISICITLILFLGFIYRSNLPL